MLMFTNGKSSGVVKKGNSEAVERHRDTLRALVKDVDVLKLGVEQAMFEAGRMGNGAVVSRRQSLKSMGKFRNWISG